MNRNELGIERKFHSITPAISVISMMNQPKAPWLKIIHRSASSSNRNTIKQKNYYDTLETSSKATHHEIKSAYFKLSKQYHPDVNSSPEAKVKFNEISSAYEILRNHNKRKQYDRGLQLSPLYHNEPHVSMRKTDFADLMEEARRVQAELNRVHYKQADGTPIYDFDAWAQQHYGKVFERRQRDLHKHKLHMEQESEKIEGYSRNQFESVVFCGFLIVLCTLAISNVQYQKNMDTPKIILDTNETVRNDNKEIQKSEN